jgi:hypothetical protein
MRPDRLPAHQPGKQKTSTASAAKVSLDFGPGTGSRRVPKAY